MIGIEGILSAYLGALYNVSLAGPTLFGPVIHAASELAGHAHAQNQQHYFILLIITVGER